MQKSAKTCSFLPPFLTQKQISPIKTHFLLPPTTPIFKISLKNPYFPLFFDFFSLLSSPFCSRLVPFGTRYKTALICVNQCLIALCLWVFVANNPYMICIPVEILWLISGEIKVSGNSWRRQLQFLQQRGLHPPV